MNTPTTSKHFRRAVLVCAALAAFSCSRFEEADPAPVPGDEPASPVRTVRFSAGLADTKAQFGTPEDGAYPTLWTASDSQVKLSLNYGGALTADLIPSDDFRSASFEAEVDFTGQDGPYTFYAVSPASAAQALSPSREAWKVTIPSEQAPTAGSVDEAGIILASASIPYTAVSPADAVDLQFEHLTAYGRMSLSNLDLGGATVQAVELTTTTPIVGDWFWKCSGTHGLTDYGASSTLTIRTNRTSGIWFACAPVDVSGQVMTVTVYTSQGRYEQMVQFPDGRKFEAGSCAVFTVDMAGADFSSGSAGTGTDFVLVTDPSTLRAGDEVLLVYTDGSKALGPVNSSGNFRDPVDVTVSGGAIASPGSATVLTLGTGSGSATWTFHDGDAYLSTASSGNYLKTSGSVSQSSSWTVSIDSGGLATIQAGSGGSTYLRYNVQNPRFSCYGSTSGSATRAVSIYRRSSLGGTADDPMLARTEYGCYLGDPNDWSLQAGLDQTSRSYNQDGIQTFTLIRPATVEEAEVFGYRRGLLKGDYVQVSVCWRRGADTILEQTYSMAIVKEEGPKVWLSDGTGRGFIIKK